jgi:glucosylceramidase
LQSFRLCLQGGPNWAGNFVDAPIIVNAKEGVFYKQPMYYALGHISRLSHRGAK